MTDAERPAALEAIAAEVRSCTACRLHRDRTNAVPGEGSPDTEVVFVGEGPGFHEDQQGRPFVGAAGSLLDELLAFVGWRRRDVFIANVVKCRPPGNRDPEPDEIATCAPYLRRQLEALDPAVIVTLGRHSLGTFLPGARISGTHGTVHPAPAESGARTAVVYAMYHPAAAFRQAALRETLFAEMANLPQVLIDARAARAARLHGPTDERPEEAAAVADPDVMEGVADAAPTDLTHAALGPGRPAATGQPGGSEPEPPADQMNLF
jgi:DNA polymerase